MRKPDATTNFEIRSAQIEDTPFLQAIELDAAQRDAAIAEARFCVEPSIMKRPLWGKA